jgi:hypothetical protein
MTTAPTSHLALAHRTSLLQHTVALALQPVLSEQEQAQLIQNLLTLDNLDATIKACIDQHLTRLYAAREALGLLLELLDESERQTIPISSIVNLLTPWHEDTSNACRGIAAMF